MHLGQVALGLWAAKHSYEAIWRLRQYEEASKKAAKYSNTADTQLQKTRTTQAAGALTILLSTVSSAYLAYDHATRSRHKHWAAYIVLYVLNVAAPLGARIHMADFWGAKPKVPFVQGFNEAIDETKMVWAQLQWIQWSWIVVGVMELALG